MEDEFFDHFDLLKNRQNKDPILDNYGKQLLSLCKSTNHIIANGRLFEDKEGNYTFCSKRGQSVTDYLLLNINDISLIQNFEVLNWTHFSDHAALTFSLKQKCSKKSKITQPEKVIYETKIIFDDQKTEEFKAHLAKNMEKLNLENEQNPNINTQIERLTSFLTKNSEDIFGKKIPINTQNSHQKKTKPKWFDEECFRKKQEFKKARNKFVKNKTDENRTAFTKSRTIYNKVRQRAKIRHKISEGQRLGNIAKTQPKKFWKSLKKSINKSKHTNNDIKIEDLYNHFNNLLGQNDESNENNETEIPNIEDLELDYDITEEEVRHAVFHQKNGKSPGPDQIAAEIIKTSYEHISPLLISIYNNLFKNAIYPESWAVGYIVPIFKGGDSKSAQNYRGITLNSILAKIYSQIILNRLTKWTTKYDKISNCQFGYQKGKSTVDCIYILNSIIAKTLSSDQKLYTVFIDYEKCYDKINRQFLWQKLITENISAKIIQAIKAMYSSVKSAIKYNKQITNTIESHLGVKQGDPSSSLLFTLFVNDILTNINANLEGIFTMNELKVFLIAYADDQVLFSMSPTSLQSMLNDIEEYCNTWGLKINVNKTKVLIFEKSKESTYYDFYLYNKKLEVVSSFKYLGVYFFKTGHWNRTQKHIADHASKALHRLFSILNQYEFKTEQKCNLFDTLVGSILNYGSEVWGMNKGNNIELIHTKFLRKILCVNTSTNLTGLYGELGRVPLYISRKINMIRYWNKLLQSKGNSLEKHVYTMLKDDANHDIKYNNNNWAYHIKSILESLGLGYLWLHQGNTNINLPLIKQRILDQYYQTWYSNINNSSRLESYCRYKHSFQIEKYLDTITERKYKIALSRFRLSSHKLEIERGRHIRNSRQERTCKLCPINAIENEFHFLLVCPFYRELRQKYLKPFYCRWPTLNKFDRIMSSTNKNEILSLSKYLYFATKLRNENEM